MTHNPPDINSDWKANAQANAAALNIVWEFVSTKFGGLVAQEQLLINGPDPVHTAKSIIERLEKL